MDKQQALNYQRIAEAIEYIKEHFKSPPHLDEVAAHVDLSPFHFQRLFREWAGTTPKKFLQFISLEHAKRVLTEQKATLNDTAYDTGLSGTGRLHDLFISMVGMTPAEYKRGGSNLTVRYSFADTLFGRVIVASTDRGVCYMAFDKDDGHALNNLRERFPNALSHHEQDQMQQDALSIFQNERSQLPLIKLHLKGTPFQMKVWEALLNIPMGTLTTYGSIAEAVGHPGASRAVGSAIGSNPVAYLIPCHRVIQATGQMGGYRWGSIRKCAMIGWESAHLY